MANPSTSLPTTAQALAAYYAELRALGVPRDVSEDLVRDVGREMHTGTAELRVDQRILARVIAEEALRHD